MARKTPWSLWRVCWLLLVFWESLALALQKEEGSDDDPGLNRFVSRPDIRATKWNVTVYHPDRLAPGYWFVGPYRILNEKTVGNGWAGAHIYDGTGELVWSGAKLFSQGNIEDFRISNVRGEYLMTLMDQGPGDIVVFDNHYELREAKSISHFNSHELNFVHNGTRALIIRGHKGRATPEMSRKIGWDGECVVDFDFFQELDVLNDWEPVFTWSSQGHVGLEESTLTEAPVERRCTEGQWDYIHTNSVDKTDDGDYLLSGRHTDTIYKISKDTGDIIWRLGGVKSDFPLDGELKFTRQHDVRVRGQNETHLLISILDNAKGIDHAAPPSYEFSRGLLLAVNERDLTYSIEKQFDHPDTEDRYSPRRGNYQVLPNGNVFMGWSEQGVQSEHSPDGTLLMEAIFAVEWLGSYRQYKFPFVGAPTTPPDVHAEAVATGTDSASTTVHVSWNGATEVHAYHLYKTTESGNKTVRVASAEKTGFETALVYEGLASRVLVNALDRDGKVLGTSHVTLTIVNKNVSRTIVDEERKFGDDGKDRGLMARLRSIFTNPIATFLFGFGCSGMVLAVVWLVRRRGGFRVLRTSRYHRLGQEKDEPAFEPFTEEGGAMASHMRDSRRQSLDER